MQKFKTINKLMEKLLTEPDNGKTFKRKKWIWNHKKHQTLEEILWPKRFNDNSLCLNGTFKIKEGRVLQNELNNKILYQQNNKELSAVKYVRTQEI